MINEDGDVALNTLPSNKSRSKPTVLSEDVIETVCEQDYIENVTRSSHRSIRQPANTTPIPCSSIFRPKSPTNRPFNCPKLTRCKLYQWRAIDSIRKTKSSEVPAKHLLHNNWQPRGETASTPHLIDNAGKNAGIDEEKLRCERQQRIRLNRAAICFDNIRWICVFLNCVILILSFLYFGSALAFTISKEVLILVMKSKVYVSLVISFYVISLIFWAVAISGFYFLWEISRNIKIHASSTLIVGIVTASIIFLQSSTQQSIEANAESQLRSSITFKTEDYIIDSWDYFHNTFKCCGVTGFLDWCHQGNLYSKINETKAESYLGTYECSIPNSCCTNYENEYENENSDIDSNITCTKLLETRKMRNLGCVDSIRKEIYHLGKMYRIITGGAAGSLILLSILSAVLFSYFIR